jgi:glucose-6-phosphate isomerase
LLLKLATKVNLNQQIKEMFNGSHVNTTEDRPALHTALRSSPETSVLVNNHDVIPEVYKVLQKMTTFTYDVYSGKHRGSTGKKIRHIVSIGIGGSNLGPEMVCKALESDNINKLDVRFVSNVDPYDLENTLKDLKPEETLFIIVSKSFKTPETLKNAKSARKWLTNKLSKNGISKHFVAVSANTEEVKKFGIDPTNMFKIWDWIGGRYSVSSAVGLPIMLTIGPKRFKEMLSGFLEMDKHYQTTSLNKNVPVIMALINIWNTNFLKMKTHGVISYDERLSLFSFHLQQLIMESLGKGVTHDGTPIKDYIPCSIYYPGVGTNAQHSFFELLHQGAGIRSPIDFIATIDPSNPDNKDLHKTLILNMIAQADVMAIGISEDELKKTNTPEDLAPHKVLPGNKPSSLIFTKKLSPKTLGELIALFEHIVHAQATILNINPFDQMGVEQGKIITSKYEKLFKEKLTLSSLKSFLNREK